MNIANIFYNKREMSVRDWAIDVTVAAVAFSFGCIQLMVTASSIVVPDLAFRQYLGMVNVVPTTAAFIALALTCVPLIVRRKIPWIVFLWCFGVYLVIQTKNAGLSLSIIGPAIALFTIAVEQGRIQTLIATLVAVVGLMFADTPFGSPSLIFFTRFQNTTIMIAAAIAGYAYKTHNAYVHETEERAREAERTREEEAARRVEEERVRIAREVHDITAHSLSAVSIQAAAAERLLDKNPEAARQALATVRSTSKNALEDIRSMIGVLRQGDENPEMLPTGSTERIQDVISFLESAGCVVELDTTHYDRTRVPAHVDMALFGILREAATNIVRHSQANFVLIRLTQNAHGACLLVQDNGGGYLGRSMVNRSGIALPVSADGKGHGIAGMAERVGVLGGLFYAGAPDGLQTSSQGLSSLGALTVQTAAHGAQALASSGFVVAVCIPLPDQTRATKERTHE